jgi:hypothetical protein
MWFLNDKTMNALLFFGMIVAAILVVYGLINISILMHDRNRDYKGEGKSEANQHEI